MRSAGRTPCLAARITARSGRPRYGGSGGSTEAHVRTRMVQGLHKAAEVGESAKQGRREWLLPQ